MPWRALTQRCLLGEGTGGKTTTAIYADAWYMVLDEECLDDEHLEHAMMMFIETAQIYASKILASISQPSDVRLSTGFHWIVGFFS